MKNKKKLRCDEPLVRKRDKEMGCRKKKGEPLKEKHQLSIAGEQAAMCMRQSGVHDDVTVRCHGNDAMGGNGCYDDSN